MAANEPDALLELMDELPDPDREQEGQTDVFTVILDESLSGELGTLARDAGLQPDRLRANALRDQAAILANASTAWNAFTLARERIRLYEPGRRAGESSRSYFIRTVRLFMESPRLAIRFALGSIGVYVLAVGIAAVITTKGLSLQTGALIVGGFLLMRAARWISQRVRYLWQPPVAAERLHAAALAYLTQLREAGVLGWIRQQINAAHSHPYETRLAFSDKSGLAEVDDPKHEIPTDAKRRLLTLIEDEAMPGGAIGLAGPRGAGKSTLMRALCSSKEDDVDILTTMVDAPVDYDPRDFVLHLFAKVCAEVIGPRRVLELRGRTQVLEPEPYLRSVLAFPLLGGVALMLVGIGVLIDSVSLSASLQRFLPSIGGLLLLGCGSILTLGWMVQEGPRRRRRRLTRELLAQGTQDGQTAMAWLQQIWFQQSFASGWSGSFESPFGFGSEVTASTELSRRQMTFPEIVDSFRDFLIQVSQTRQIRIGIDELDKMDDATACRFLNEIKVIFRVPGCFFLISISEDAMSSFERRGLAFRDVFDSSFDDVIRVPCLSLDDSRALLARRIVGLPTPFVALLHCISGGLPRDLIRAARKLVNLPPRSTITTASANMIEEAMRSRDGGARVAARRFGTEAQVGVLVEWLNALSGTMPDPQALIEVLMQAESNFLAPIVGSGEHEAEIRALGLQVTAFGYLGATVLQFFSSFDREDFVDRAMATKEGDSLVDRLAMPFQHFPVDLGSAWEDISNLRSECGMEPLTFPGNSGARATGQPFSAAG
jgi:hypothetical protein